MMRRMSVCVLVMMLGMGVVAKGTGGQPGPQALVGGGSYRGSIEAIVEEARQGDAGGVAQAMQGLVVEMTGQGAGSFCVRGMPSEPILDIKPVDPNSLLTGLVQMPAGPSAKGQSELWFRVLELEADLGSCSATGIAFVAYTSSAVHASDAGTWMDWVNQ